MDILANFYPWIDALWLLAVLALVHPGQKVMSAIFVLLSMVMMRLLVELMQVLGFEYGVFGLLQGYDAFERGMIVYSVFYVLFIVMAHYSPGSRGAVFMAAAISLFFMALVTASAIMVL